MGNVSLEQAASIIGEENVQKLIDAFPGGQIYFRRDFIDVQSRNKALVEDFYASDLDRSEFARKHNLSVSSIDKIIKKAAEEKHNI